MRHLLARPPQVWNGLEGTEEMRMDIFMQARLEIVIAIEIAMGTRSPRDLHARVGTGGPQVLKIALGHDERM